MDKANKKDSLTLVASCIFAANLIYVIFIPYASRISMPWSHLFSNTSALISLLGIMSTFLCLKFFDESKAAWLLLFLGIALSFLNELGSAYFVTVAGFDLAFPTIADGFRLSSYLFLSVGLLYLVLGFKSAGFPVGSWREFVSIAGLLGIVLCLLGFAIFVPIFRNPDVTNLQKTLYLLYPIADFILIFLIILILRITTLLGEGSFFKPWRFMTAGFITMTIGNLLFAYYATHNIIPTESISELFTNAGFLLIAIGAVAQRKIIKSL
ncbi:MAG: hypothetical protein ABH868_02860 [bacterium]